MKDDLQKQIRFIKELEKLKIIYRQNAVLENQRYENSAEHSWHVAIMAILLKDSSIFENLDISKIVKMLLIHDIVEIDAGDTFLYDAKRDSVQKEEGEAAKRIFGLLPVEDASEYLSLWNEFELMKTNEAKFAKAMDALQPLINHSLTGVKNNHNLSREQVIVKKIFIKDISEELWEVALEAIDVCVEKGLFFK